MILPTRSSARAAFDRSGRTITGCGRAIRGRRRSGPPSCSGRWPPPPSPAARRVPARRFRRAPPRRPRGSIIVAPPWVVDPARPESGVDGWSAAVCPVKGPGRSAYFVHEGTREITELEARAVLKAVRSGSESGLGGCCSAEVERKIKVLCLRLQTGLCRQPMSRVVEFVDRVLRQRGLADARIGVDVSLRGEVGPRCDGRIPACGPVPARKRERRRPSRRPASLAASSWAAKAKNRSGTGAAPALTTENAWWSAASANACAGTSPKASRGAIWYTSPPSRSSLPPTAAASPGTAIGSGRPRPERGG